MLGVVSSGSVSRSTTRSVTPVSHGHHSPSAANAAMPARPITSRRAAARPSSAPKTASSSAVPISSAILSYVPKTSMASCLSDSGTRSTTSPPTATSGADRGPVRTATGSAAPSATTAATTPADAARRGERVLTGSSLVAPRARLPISSAIRKDICVRAHHRVGGVP
ncbi:hypothetical protein DLJ57_04755 [Micromonospora chalcea]|nr:hypothetical protein DLJ57_04755 [Micromonospora chalcea]